MRAIPRARAALGRVRARFAPSGLILLYHRIADPPSDPFGLSVTPAGFAEHLEVIRKLARPTSLPDLVRSLGGRRVPRRAVVLTFDDGYADNLHAARPLLERFEIPATVFIATGYVGGDREFWWDDLERSLFTPGTSPRIPEVLQGAGGSRGSDGVGDFGESDALGHRGFRYADAGSPHPRHSLYREIYPILQAMPPEARDRAIGDLRRSAGLADLARADRRPLSGEELARLAESPLIDLGAHTIDHPLLTALPGPGRRLEILGSKASLEEMIGRREAGFASACTTRVARLSRGEFPMDLPRVVPEGEDGASFERFLRRWLDVGRGPG